MKTQRYLLKTGEHAGKIVEGQGCNARPFPDSTDVDWAKYGDGIWIPSLELRIRERRDGSYKAKHCGDYIDYEDLVIAFDKFGAEIFVGDTLYVANSNKEVIRLKIEKIGKEFHAGCGWMQRTLHGIDIDSGERTKTSYPSRAIKIK
jgi:hypothetical protein